MKKPRRLSLEEEMERELQQIKKELSEHPELDDIQVTEEMDAALLAKIRAYENEKAEEEAAKREIEEKLRNRDVEFSEELVPDISVLAELSSKMKENTSGDADAGVDAAGENFRGEGDTKTEKVVEGKKTIPYRRKKRRYLFVSLVAVMVLVLGLGMTSVGSKSYLKVLWENIVGEESMHGIDVEDMKKQDTEDVEEVAAYKELVAKLGIDPVRMKYKPRGMVLVDSEIDNELLQARLFYEYKNEIIRYTIYVNDTDSSWGEKEEDIKVNKYTVVLNNIEIIVEEFEIPDGTEYRQIADFEYLGVHYQLKGIMEREEFEKILKNLVFW